MSEVDVFEHPRFCDEFSHLVKTCFFYNGNSFYKSHVDGIDALDDSNHLLNSRIFFAAAIISPFN